MAGAVFMLFKKEWAVDAGAEVWGKVHPAGPRKEKEQGMQGRDRTALGWCGL